jgi:hypothetical protein
MRLATPKQLKRKKLIGLELSFTHNGNSKPTCLWTLCRRHFRDFFRKPTGFPIDGKKKTLLPTVQGCFMVNDQNPPY